MTDRHSQSCERTRGLISRSLDCELPELQRTLLRTHLRRCPDCASFERDVRTITTALRQAPLEQLRRAIAPPRRRRRVRMRVAVQAASIALVAVGVGSLALPSGPLFDHVGEQALLGAVLAENAVNNDSIRALRDDAVRQGEIAVLPDASSDPLGEAKPALPAVPA